MAIHIKLKPLAIGIWHLANTFTHSEPANASC
jgi:hypothetical protein